MKKNYLLIGAAVIAAYYFFLRKPKMASTTSASPIKKSLYPAGLMEGDYVKFGLADTIYVLYGGSKLPASKTWWDANVGQDRYEMVKNYPAAAGFGIPTGNTL
jgi:hypothetical protein